MKTKQKLPEESRQRYAKAGVQHDVKRRCCPVGVNTQDYTARCIRGRPGGAGQGESEREREREREKRGRGQRAVREIWVQDDRRQGERKGRETRES